MADGSEDRPVFELPAFARAAKQQSPATHISASHEVRGKEQAFAEDLYEDVHVLSARDRTEKHDLAPVRPLGQAPRGARERPAVAMLGGVDGDARETLEVTQRHRLLGCKQARARRDNENPGRSFRRPREVPRVSEFPPEIQAGEKAEHVAE